MPRLRIAAPSQLSLGIADLVLTGPERWSSLPTEAQEAVIGILARMIANGIVVTEEEGASDDTHR